MSPTCTCSAVDRIVADNKVSNGTAAQRIIRMIGGVCNACGGKRP
jgi:hypothetical protein